MLKFQTDGEIKIENYDVSCWIWLIVVLRDKFFIDICCNYLYFQGGMAYEILYYKYLSMV